MNAGKRHQTVAVRPFSAAGPTAQPACAYSPVFGRKAGRTIVGRRGIPDPPVGPIELINVATADIFGAAGRGNLHSGPGPSTGIDDEFDGFTYFPTASAQPAVPHHPDPIDPIQPEPVAFRDGKEDDPR